jgi:hypothetical protein
VVEAKLGAELEALEAVQARTQTELTEEKMRQLKNDELLEKMVHIPITPREVTPPRE